MIEMHDGNCQPFTIDRDKGRDVNRPAWDLRNGQLFRAEAPLLGWRIAPFAYSDRGIEGVGEFRPSPRGESPFGDGINSLPPARCRGLGRALAPDGARLLESIILGPHTAPHPKCTCGYRLVHDVKDIARYLHRHRNEAGGFTNLPEGMHESVAIFAVRGLGLTTRSVEFKHFNDPLGTVRTQHVSLEAIVLLGQEDAHTAPMFEALGFTVHVLENLTGAHEAERCGSEYDVTRVQASAEHALRLSEAPGRDGGTHFTTSGEWGSYGAAGVLLKTSAKEPRYLLQKRSPGVTYGGMWSIPGGARHEHERPGEAAARELSEEMGISTFAALKVTGAVTLQSEGWTYHTIIAECSRRPQVTPNAEVTDAAWLAANDIRNLAAGGALHPLFEAALPELLN